MDRIRVQQHLIVMEGSLGLFRMGLGDENMVETKDFMFFMINVSLGYLKRIYSSAEAYSRKDIDHKHVAAACVYVATRFYASDRGMSNLMPKYFLQVFSKRDPTIDMRSFFLAQLWTIKALDYRLFHTFSLSTEECTAGPCPEAGFLGDPFLDPMANREIILERQFLLIEKLLELIHIYKKRFQREREGFIDIVDLAPHGHANLLIETDFVNLAEMWKYLGPNFDLPPKRVVNEIQNYRNAAEFRIYKGIIHEMPPGDVPKLLSHMENYIIEGVRNRRDLCQAFVNHHKPTYERPLQSYNAPELRTMQEMLDQDTREFESTAEESNDIYDELIITMKELENGVHSAFLKRCTNHMVMMIIGVQRTDFDVPPPTKRKMTPSTDSSMRLDVIKKRKT